MRSLSGEDDNEVRSSCLVGAGAQPFGADSRTAGEIIASREHVAPSMPAGRVSEIFFNSPVVDALALVECGEPVGLVSKAKLLFTLFRRFGFELFGRKPIIAISDTSPLVLCESERLDVALGKALERPADDIYDEIIVTDDGGRYRGLLSVKQMVIQQSNALANSILQKEMASARVKELETIEKMKSQFIAHVTHELRTPVNAIIGLAELMRRASEKGHIDRLRDRLSILMSSATNLRAIITNILDLSKLEAGKMEVINGRFDAAALLDEVAETTRILVGGKPVEVAVAAYERPAFIVSDQVKVRQVLVNLAGNAAKFTEKGGITLALSVKDKRLHLTVSDTGVGIKEDDLEKLFTAFSQLEDAKTKRHEGTGLGLTITKSLLGLLGGEISVASSYGRWTSFDVLLPFENNLREGVDGTG